MATKRILQSSINWSELAERVPLSQQSNLSAFKAKSEGYVRRVMEAPEQPPKIDWAYYKSNATNKAVVEQFEKAYNALKIPYPSGEDALQSIASEQKKWNDDLKVFIERSNERIKKYEQELQMFKDSPRLEDMNNEEQVIAYPHLAIDSFNEPTVAPHVPELQPTKEDLEFFRERKLFHKPDKYHP